MEDFTGNEETPKSKTDIEGSEPDKVDGPDEPSKPDVDDTQYRLESVPDQASDYIVDSKITDGENYDEDFLNSFRDAGHTERLTQKQFGNVISWWEKTGVSFGKSGYGDDFHEAFDKFAIKQNLTAGQVKNLTTWFNGIIKQAARQVERVKKFAKQAHGRSGTNGRAARIAQLLASKHYTSKTDLEAHKTVIKELNNLYKQGG